MLFRTVYGPELEAIYSYILEMDAPPGRQMVHAAFLPQSSGGLTPSTQNIDDALSFLESAQLITETDGHYTIMSAVGEPFRIKTLRRLRALELGDLEPSHPLDPLYSLILTELFLKPNQLFVADVHTQANKLRQVADAGGLSREKLQAWRRVMAYLGVGRRISTGFMGVYSPQLLLDVIGCWAQAEGTLQQFLETHLVHILPFHTENGDLAHAIAGPLQFMEAQQAITLQSLQDSPSKPYFGERRIKYIKSQYHIQQEAAYVC